MSTPDQWAWYKAALGGTRGPINANEPQSGFYEDRSKNRTTNVVTRSVAAYWTDDSGVQWFKFRDYNAIRLDVDNEQSRRAFERWPFLSKRPISHSVYEAVRKTGHWPDENRAAAADRQGEEAATKLANSEHAPDDDSFEALQDRIADLAREAERVIAAGAAKTKDASDQAADLADRLRKLETRADNARDAEKRPHDEASKAVQKKWKPLVERAADFKERLKFVVVTPFLKAESAKAQAAQAAAIKAGAPVETAPRTAGTTASVGLRTVKAATITDYPKALAYFAENAKVRELIQQLANAAVRQGTTPDGCEVFTDQKAA